MSNSVNVGKNPQSSFDRAQMAYNRRRRYLLLLIIIVLMSVLCLYQWSENRYHVSQLSAAYRQATERLADKVNPNRAEAASLVRLPGIGPMKAQAIIEYRQKKLATNQKQNIIFSCANDLEQVKGIGPGTVENIKEYLVFE